MNVAEHDVRLVDASTSMNHYSNDGTLAAVVVVVTIVDAIVIVATRSACSIALMKIFPDSVWSYYNI